MTVVFVHAHPDDEAIFTGGTMARLSAAGVPVVLVVATGGELGTLHPAYHGAIDDVGLAGVRRRECEAAAARARGRPRRVPRLPRLGHGR